MSANYDNWERLVAAVLKRVELLQLFHAQSRSTSISSESSSFSFSFGLASEDGPISSPEWSVTAANHEEIHQIWTARDFVRDKPQSTVERPSADKHVASKPFWKRTLNIEVPKLRAHNHGGAISPKSSPRITSPTPGSRDHGVATAPLHARAGNPANWPDDSKHEAHPLPLPPTPISNSSPVSHRSSAETSPSVPHTPERAESPIPQGGRWKKGKLLDRDGFGDVYLGFNSEKGEMCAMKEASLSFANSKQSAKAVEKEITLLSSLSHPNIVQCYGSEKLGDNLYICFEYVSGGSICKILKRYGNLGESAIRSYARQILAGLAYLHSKNIAHRDIKGANILVDPHGIVKLINFGVGKHILLSTRRLHSSLLTDSPYWMAPEAIMNPDACNLDMDIWSLGCTIVEMATSKPPMSKYDGGVAVFKVANRKELPAIPDRLSGEGKDFLRHCFQWNPKHRATSYQLLEHPFVRNYFPSVKPMPLSPSPCHPAAAATENCGHSSKQKCSQLSRIRVKSATHATPTTDIYTPRRYISAPVSPVGSPLPHPNSPRCQNGRMSPPHIYSLPRPNSPRCQNGRMSPPPIYSPSTGSPSSSSPSGGIGTTPYPYLNQPILAHETLHKKSPTITNLYYWDSNILHSRQAGVPTFQDMAPPMKMLPESGQLGMASHRQAAMDVYGTYLKAPVKVNHYHI